MLRGPRRSQVFCPLDPGFGPAERAITSAGGRRRAKDRRSFALRFTTERRGDPLKRHGSLRHVPRAVALVGTCSAVLVQVGVKWQ
jgi:hypothetical protein